MILIHVPSLKERKEDIPLLVDHFNQIISEELGMGLKTFDSSAISALQDLDWTGNIREFRNVIERLIILGNQKITDKEVKAYAVPVW